MGGWRIFYLAGHGRYWPGKAVGVVLAAGYYVRQLWDMKGSVNLDTLDPADLAPYDRLCGWVLARAHARSGDGATISGYLGTGDRFDRAVADFAEAYADQTEADYAAFTRAWGSAPAEGVGVAARTNGKETEDDPVDPGHVGVRGHAGVHARARVHWPGAAPSRPPGALRIRSTSAWRVST